MRAVARGTMKNIRGRSNIGDRRDKGLGLLDVIVGIVQIPGAATVNKSAPSTVFKHGRVHAKHSIDGGTSSQDFTPRLNHYPVFHVRLGARYILPVVEGSNEQLRKCMSRNIWESKSRGSIEEQVRGIITKPEKKTYQWNRGNCHWYHQLRLS